MNIRFMKQSDIQKCPHVIMLPEHYRDDGSCKCNDPLELVMIEWGYVWDTKAGQWVSPPDEE